ncbi:MAG: feruloyl-CoA synthase [Hydrogenophaga sp.]|uniref:feruloyl-CoA synthase n=1 Tax=Hydrogenophaga sp. TaxID=1904254 RepID=UPI001E11A1D2|nr:feruloyl-CoA synthase [Hydrogenophaga sp.]MBX3608884.1 feruloyl-CoA synthase [Hydrogenophaga sp.]
MSALDWLNNTDWLAAPSATVEHRADGSFVLRSSEPLGDHARCVGDWLEHWAQHTPAALAVAERAGDGWRRMSWAELRSAVGRIAQALLERDLPPDAPVVVVSDNAIDHLLLVLATQHIGRASCTVSSAYCRLTQDHTKIHGILRTLQPALIYASDAAVYGHALETCGLDVPLVFSQGAGRIAGATDFAQLLATDETPAVQAAFAAITPDTTAKYLLTSGSTGTPKVVINTHRMLCANQQMIAQTWRFLRHEKPVLVDWLPWSHTFGGNHNLHMVMCHGGTLVIDEGRPAPGLIDKTVANLAEMQPTIWFNVPRGFDMAMPLLEADDELARRVLGRLRAVFYAGAALPQASWERLQALARKVLGREIWLTTSWGSTETAPAVTSAHWRMERAGVIGGVLPGLALKFVPNGEKLEMRIKGVSIFPGYRHAPELTAKAFDDEGYYCIGDAGLLADAGRPEHGVVFNGRVAEDFKLTTGTWVSVGTLRLRVVSALAPYAQDAVITGHDSDQIGVLVFPTAAALQMPRDLLEQHIARGLAVLRAEGGGSSQSPTRARVLDEPPNADAGEITDKGYLNQRAVLQRRAHEVAALQADAPGTLRPATPEKASR